MPLLSPLAPTSILASPPTSPSTRSISHQQSPTSPHALFANCPPTYRHLWATQYYPSVNSSGQGSSPSPVMHPASYKLRILERSELNGKVYSPYRGHSSCVPSLSPLSSEANSSSTTVASGCDVDVDDGAEETGTYPMMGYSTIRAFSPPADSTVRGERWSSSTTKTTTTPTEDRNIHRKPVLSFSIEALIGIK